ncbi:restriction endonuclease subunit S [Vibrio coralliilyticus]
MSDLPTGWKKIQLGEVIELKYGKSLPAKSRDGDGFPVYGSNGIVGKHSTPLVSTGGLVVGRKGSFGEVHISDTPFSPIDTTYFVDDIPSGSVKYWYYQLKKLPLTKLNRSTAIPGLNREDAYKQTILLPPESEQKRIVEKLDEVLAQVDTIKARLDGIPDLLKRFRQSVLASAVSGKLTEKSDEVWRECVLEEVSTFQNGFAFKSGWFNEAGDYQVIKLGNIKDDHLKLDAAPAYLDSEQAELHLKFKPNVGDLLLSMTGTKFKRDYGFCCLVTEELPILINQRVGRIIPHRDIVSPEFLHLFLRSQMFRNQFFSGETGGVNQGNVGSKHIMACTLKVPQMEEQVAIAEKAKVLFDFANCIEAQVKKAQARVDNLTQSILAKAFRGELVAQDPSDEPADKLLERIAKARVEAEALAKAAKKAEAAKKRAAKA